MNKQAKLALASIMFLMSGRLTLGQERRAPGSSPGAAAVAGASDDAVDAALDARRERQALQVFLASVKRQIVSAAEAMPADKYGFVPTDGEFKGVRTFAQQVKHLAATNEILAAAALGENPPTDAGDEVGPESVRTKAEIFVYLNESFAHLGNAINGIGEKNAKVRSSPISPLTEGRTTRLGLTVEALIHAFNHYGQMVEYLRMNGIVPPASRA